MREDYKMDRLARLYLNEIVARMIAAYHPQTDGQSERTIQTLCENVHLRLSMVEKLSFPRLVADIGESLWKSWNESSMKLKRVELPSSSSSSVPADFVPAGHVIISADRYSEYADLSYRPTTVQQFKTATISATMQNSLFRERKIEIWVYGRWSTGLHECWNIIFGRIVSARKQSKEENKVRTIVLQLYLKIICLIFIIMMMQGIFGWQLRLEEEGLHKGYDRFQKILSQLNQVQARPDNDDINLKFLRALPSSWSQVGLALKTRGGLDSMSFDDLKKNKGHVELDAELVIVTTSGHSDNIMECVLHSFVAENEQDQDMIYEDFDQVDQLEMEEMDLKWQMLCAPYED
ncbi:hypothetical protein Tco_0442789 [Tanacetum coccineum]